MSEILIRYLHFIGIIVLSASLVLEHVLLEWDMHSEKFKRLARVDAFFGISAAIVLLTGLGQWFFGFKPSIFYSHNWIFHLKITLFVVIAILSIYPTLFFVKHRKHAAEQVVVPKWIPIILRAELTLLLAMPLCAVLMARGIGYF